MQQILKKRTRILITLLVFSGFISCEEQGPPEFNCLDSGDHHLQIVPDSPTSKDTILAIDSICGNETDAILDFHGQQITFTRYLNSLMMMPCRPRADTTLIGQLSPGQYRLVHCLIDKNHHLKDSIILLDTICLLIK